MIYRITLFFLFTLPSLVQAQNKTEIKKIDFYGMLFQANTRFQITQFELKDTAYHIKHELTDTLEFIQHISPFVEIMSLADSAEAKRSYDFDLRFIAVIEVEVGGKSKEMLLGFTYMIK